jgi:hypothetical protein
MIIQGQVGPLSTSTSISAGQQTIARYGNMGDQIVSELHGRYYEAAYRRSIYYGANPTAVTTTAVTSGTTTAITGIAVSNPINSPVNLVLLKAGYSLFAVGAASSFFLGVGYNSSTNVTHTTALTVRNGYVGVSSAGYGLVDSSYTVPTAMNFTHTFGSVGSVATTSWASGPAAFIDFEGSVILPPGAYAAILTNVAQTSNFFGSMSWEEVPL